MARKVSGTEAGIPIDDERLLQVLELVRGADSVELKLSVPDSERRTTTRSLGLDPIEAELRQIVFFDTPELPLNTEGDRHRSDHRLDRHRLSVLETEVSTRTDHL